MVETSIQIARVEPLLAAVVRKSVPLALMAQAQREARDALEAALKAADVARVRRALTVWRPPLDGFIDYAPGVFVPYAFDTAGAVSFLTLPEGRAAHLTMRGPYDGLPSAWRRLFGACEAQGLKLAGLNWEIYGDPETPSATVETELYALLE